MAKSYSNRHRADVPTHARSWALSLIAVSILSGCATCQRHPVECGAIVGVVATSIALSVNQPGRDHHEPAVGPERPTCGRGPC